VKAVLKDTNFSQNTQRILGPVLKDVQKVIITTKFSALVTKVQAKVAKHAKNVMKAVLLV
jgi:hypothetical protein